MKLPIQRCRACKAEIVFLVTRASKTIPVDVSSLTDADRKELAEWGTIDYRHGEHVSHFATCPAAKEFRRNARS